VQKPFRRYLNMKKTIPSPTRPFLLAAFAISFAIFAPLHAYTSTDADSIIDAYNNAFFKERGSSGYYIEKKGKGPTYFWSQAEEIEGALDAYERTWTSRNREVVSELLHGFVKTNGKTWEGNKYNDDCMWACIAFGRAYLDTGNDWFLLVDKANYKMVYARAWDDKLGGGMWWTTDKTGKNACINGPAAIAAYLLYKGTGEQQYLDQANALYTWDRDKLFNRENGVVADNMGADGKVNGGATTYNQGTFVGAASYLGYDDDAALASNFTMNHMGDMTASGFRIMPLYGTDGNNSGFNGIAIRWIARFMVDKGRQKAYLPWLQANAQAAWDVRRVSDNLSWCQWTQPTPDKLDLGSWDCISSVVALQIVPPPASAPVSGGGSTLLH
jgi:predicted alpha-1,6-mannanase (GH76 family)